MHTWPIHPEGRRERRLLVVTPNDGIATRSATGFDRLRAAGWQVTVVTSTNHAWELLSNGSAPWIALIRMAVPHNAGGRTDDLEANSQSALDLARRFVFRGVEVIPWTPEIPFHYPLSSGVVFQFESDTRRIAFSSLPGAFLEGLLNDILNEPPATYY